MEDERMQGKALAINLVGSGQPLEVLFFFFFFKLCLFIYLLFELLYSTYLFFWLHWVFIAVHGFSLVTASGGYSWLRCAGFSSRWLLL